MAALVESTDTEHFPNHKGSIGWHFYLPMVAILSSLAKPLYLPGWSLEKLLEDNISTGSAKSSKNITFSSLRIRKGHPSWVAMLFSCWRPTGHLVLWAGRQRPRGGEENTLDWDSEDMGSHLSSTIGFVPFVLWMTSLNFSFCIYQMKITKPI